MFGVLWSSLRPALETPITGSGCTAADQVNSGRTLGNPSNLSDLRRTNQDFVIVLAAHSCRACIPLMRPREFVRLVEVCTGIGAIWIWITIRFLVLLRRAALA